MSTWFDFVRRVARAVEHRKAKVRIGRELADVSDRALAELHLARGDVADVVAGRYRREA